MNTMPSYRQSGRWVVIAMVLLGFAVAWLARQMRFHVAEPAQQALVEVRRQQAASAQLPSTASTTVLGRTRWPGAFQLVASDDVLAAVKHAGSWHLGTTGGLVVLPPSGPPRRFTALDGLPGNRISALASFGGALWLGTSGQGLAQLRGENLTSHRLGSPALDRITGLLATRDRLYIGTQGAGVIEFDGTSFRKQSSRIAGVTTAAVSGLAPRPAGFAAALQDLGVLLSDGAGQALAGSELQKITAIASRGQDLLAGTPYGLHRIDSRGSAVTELPDIHVTAIWVEEDGMVLAGTFEGEIHRLPLWPRRASSPAAWRKLPGQIHAIVRDGKELLAATSAGAFRLDSGQPRPLGKLPGLARAHVAALAADGAGALWIGYFDGGVERLEPGSRAPAAVPGLSDAPGVNHLRWDAPSGRMAVCTMRGVCWHDGRAPGKWLRAADGLIGDNVSFSLRDRDFIYYGTEKGLTRDANGRLESVSVFHGLASNHVYCAAMSGKHLALGTLGGLSLLDGLHVVRNVQAAPSGLPANWVSALLAVPQGLLVGTYGGGLTLMKPDGSMDAVSPRVEINPNALIPLGARVAAGTLDRGVLIAGLDPGEAPAAMIADGLGHADATALAFDGRRLWIGTEAGLTSIPIESVP